MDRIIGIVGSGKVATHLLKYFTELGLTCITWSRKNDKGVEPVKKLEYCSVIFVLVSDGSIEEVAGKLQGVKGTVVHCSGSLVVPGVPSYHPLMTFTDRPMELEVYRSIPFIQEKGALPLTELVPGLPNPVYTLPAHKKGLYHALCVLSGNFSAFLWKRAMDAFEEKLDLPREVLIPYLEGVTENLEITGGSSLSGPLARGDHETVNKNLEALEDDPYREIYQAFVKIHMPGSSG